MGKSSDPWGRPEDRQRQETSPHLCSKTPEQGPTFGGVIAPSRTYGILSTIHTCTHTYTHIHTSVYTHSSTHTHRVAHTHRAS